MTLHIIHMPDRIERIPVLMKELQTQNITDYRLWDGIHDVKGVPNGVNKAHKQIIRYAKEEGLPEVMIAEDDIKFCDEGAFDYYINNKPDDFDMYMGGIYLGKIDENNITERFTGMHLYIVNERFYDVFLSLPEHNHIDALLAGLGKYVVCNPFPAIQHNGWSDNSKKYCNYDVIFEHRKLYKKDFVLA